MLSAIKVGMEGVSSGGELLLSFRATRWSPGTEVQRTRYVCRSAMYSCGTFRHRQYVGRAECERYQEAGAVLCCTT